MTDQKDIELYLKAISTYKSIADIADRFIKRKTNVTYWKRQKKNALANCAYLKDLSDRPRPDNYKAINVGFILVNKDKMNLQEMADALNVSIGKIRSTIKEFQIEYKRKPPTSTIY